jgi:hypothetical protein
VEDGRGWAEHYKKEWNKTLSPKALGNKREAIRCLGETIGQMHSKGIFHGDLRWGNIIMTFFEAAGPGFVFLDNERTFDYGRLPYEKRLRNLVQLNMATYPSLTNTDRMRFFTSYLSKNPGYYQKRKILASDVLKWTRKRLAKKGIY